MKKIYFYLLLVLLNFSCSGEHEIMDDVNSNNTENNQPPTNFIVKVDSVTHESAYLSWEKPTDPENDEIKYDVVLKGNVLLSGSSKLALKLSNLTELNTYTGEVIAKDIHNNSTKVNFVFSTPKYYLKFLKKYSFPQTNYGGIANQIIKLRDENYLILCMNRDAGFGRKITVIKVDKFGDEIWNKKLPIDYAGDVGGFNMKMVQCANSDKIIIGGGSNISKIDFDGNVMWVKNLTPYNVSWIGSGIESLVEDSNNNIYAVGHTKSTNSQKHSAGHLTKLSSDGTIIFDNTYENSFTTEFHDIIIDNQKLVIFGTKEISGITWDQYLANNPLQVKYNMISTDQNGVILNEQNYNNAGYAFAKGIFKKSNGNYVFFGYSSVSDYITNIYEVSPNGNIIWGNNYNYGQVNVVKETNDGKLVAIGISSGSFYTRTFIYLNDNLGNNIWSRNFYEIGMEFFGRDVLPDNDGGYRFLVTYGKSIKSISEDYGLVKLYKTDPDGNY